MCMHNTYYMLIAPDKLKVDSTYQRNIDPNWVKKIVDNFNMDLFNAPKVSKRNDGFFYIFDGQNSMVAHKRVFGDDRPINCKVYEGLTYSEEVELFVQQNGFSRAVNTNDKLKAKYNDPKSDVRDMVNAARIAGVRIDFVNGDSQNHISASGTAYSIWKILGKDNFINVLDVIKQTWGGEAKSFSSGILKGIAYVYNKYGDQIQNSRMISALGRHTTDWYIREASDMKGTMTLKYAKLMVEAYNYRRTSNKLEEFWEVR